MKILKKVESELAQIDDSTLEPTGEPITPEGIVLILGSLRGVIITVLQFMKLVLSDESDAKIDKAISWLQSLPIPAKP